MCDELKPIDYMWRDVQSSLEFWKPMTHQKHLQVGLYGSGQFRHPEIQEELTRFKQTFNVRKSWPYSERRKGIGLMVFYDEMIDEVKEGETE